MPLNGEFLLQFWIFGNIVRVDNVQDDILIVDVMR